VASRKPSYFLGLLKDSWNKESTDSRDKVFALLGLATDAHKSALLPDYSKSSTQIFKEAVDDLITREGNLDMLTCGWNSDLLRDYPSWCPDWTATGRKERRAVAYYMNKNRFCSSGNLQPAVIFSKNFSILLSPGVAVDTIKPSGVVPSDPEKLGYTDEMVDECVSLHLCPGIFRLSMSQ